MLHQQRKLQLSQPTAHTVVSHRCRLVHHVPGLLRGWVYHGRVPLLSISTRHDQGSHYGCESILAGAFDVVIDVPPTSCDSESYTPQNTTFISLNHEN